MSTPFVPQFSPDQLAEGADIMQRQRPGDIEKAYRMGRITLKEKVLALRQYGQLQRELAVRGEMAQQAEKTKAVSALGGGGMSGAAVGEVKFYIQNVVKEFQHAWDAASRETKIDPQTKKITGPSKSEAALYALMGSLEAMKIFDVPGDIAERWVLEVGVTPGLARATNWAVWGMSNFGGIGALLKLPLKAAGAGVRAERKAVGAIKEWVNNPFKKAAEQAMELDTAVAASGKAGDIAKAAKATVKAEETGGKIAAEAAAPEAKAAIGEAAEIVIESPKDIERLSTLELINHYGDRAERFARRGTSHAKTATEAQASPLNFEEIITRAPGEKISAAELERISSVHSEVMKGFNTVVNEAAKRVEDIAAGNAPELAQAFKSHLQAIELTNPAFMGARGESGRALEYMKTMQGLVGESQLVDSTLKALGADALKDGSDEAIAKAIERLTLLTRENRDKFIGEASKATYTPGILHSFFKTLLFLSPSTHAVNLVSGEAMVGSKMIEKTLQSFMPFSQGPSIAETKAMWAGFMETQSNIPRLWRQAIERSSESMDKYGLEGAQDVLARYGTGRALALEDEFVSGPLEAGLMRAAGERKMLEQVGSRSKEEQAAFLDNLFGDPQAVQALRDEVAPEVAETMFRAPLSAWGETGARWIRNSPIDFQAPIIKFPINSLKIARDWTPGIQVLSKKFADEIAEGGAKEAAARTRMTLSWMMTNMVWSAAKAGVITGGGPQDPDANKIWRDAGNVPYAIHGIPFRWAEPFGTFIGAIADMAHASNQMDPGDVDDFTGAVGLVMQRAVENNYWIRIMEGLSQTVSDAKQVKKFEDVMLTVGKAIAQPAITMATGGPLGSRFREQFDQEVKDIRGIGELYISKVPGWSKSIRPQLNFSGKPRVMPPILGGPTWLSFFSPPFRTPDADNDSVARFMEKHELTVQDDWKSFGGSADADAPLSTPSGQAKVRANLDGNESHDWKKLSLTQVRRAHNNKNWVEQIAELDADPSFAAKSRKQKQDKVNTLWHYYKDKGAKMLIQLNPVVAAKDAAARIITKESQGKTPFTNEPDVDLPETEAPVTPSPIEVPPETGAPTQ
jgi:hypothetical protein